MSTPHINAQPGDFAKTVLMPGDPLRAKYIAETFLENPRLVTSVRNMLGYTGTYKGVPVSVMGSGMGIPSIGIYSYELFNFYKVENIIRIGSAGSYTDKLNVMDVVLAESAYSESTYALCTNKCTDNVMFPNAQLNASILAKATEMGMECKLAKIHSSDAFYTDETLTWQELSEKTNTDCVEMESFALFHNANRLGKRATCLLTISDSFVHKQALTAEQRQHSFVNMMKLALESAISW